ncbi:unnamed protein product [Echinostoma caproni]|uniref:Aha1_N domain-containing protein n=1 Tax=Echinostoma caproni TaxID=27848 RepID=A0A183AEU8_9TREM|nr:unnamed protein product [Echinostoma caproni]
MFMPFIFVLGQKKTGNNKSKFRGKAEVMNLSEEYSIDELDVLISCTSTSADGDAIRKFMQTEGVKGIQGKLAEYLRVLKEEYSQNLILPTKNGPNVVQSQDSCKPSDGTGNQSHTAAADIVSRKPKDLSVKKLTLTEEFFCTPDDLYKVLTTKELVQAFTRGDADVEATSDGKYSIFGGNITGVFGLLTPGKTIEMRWRKRDWPEEHYSQLSLELSPFEGGTRLNLTQTGVPGYDLENTTNGWRSNFFAALKQTYGYGGRMF